MAFLKVEHLACPRCFGRPMTVSKRVRYDGPIPLKGEEGTPYFAFTCIECGETLKDLEIVGVYDAADEFEKALNVTRITD